MIAKPEFYRWYAKFGWKHCTRVRDDRAAYGTRFHKEIQNFLEGKEVWLDNVEMQETFQVFLDWYESHDIKPEGLEVRLFNDELGVAGTCDFVGFFDGELWVIDWKTSKRVYDNYGLQVAIYLWMYEQQYDKVCRGAGVVCFRDGKVHEKYFTRSECMNNLEVYKHARELYRWKYGK